MSVPTSDEDDADPAELESATLRKDLHELRGRTLVCHCRGSEACHGMRRPGVAQGGPARRVAARP